MGDVDKVAVISFDAAELLASAAQSNRANKQYKEGTSDVEQANDNGEAILKKKLNLFHLWRDAEGWCHRPRFCSDSNCS